MAETSFEPLWAAIDRLTEPRRGVRRREPERSPEERLVLAALDGPAFRPRVCPHCSGRRLQRWGTAGGLQRYRCTACLRTSNPLTGTPLARLRRRDLWLGHAAALAEAASLRTAARRLGVHQHTTFRWRHRWLAGPARLQAETLGGIIEVDAVPFRETGKGWPKGRRVAISAEPRSPSKGGGGRPRSPRPPPVHALLLRDRKDGLADALLPRLDGPAIAGVLGPLVRGGPAILCSDAGPAITAAARMIGVAHRPVGRRVEGAVPRDLVTVRGHVERLAAWMLRFRGVSTRYLAHYLGWRRALERAPVVPGPLAWLRLAHGRKPTANVGNADRAGEGGSVKCRADPRMVVSSAFRRPRDRAAAAVRAR